MAILIAPLFPKKRHSSKDAVFDNIGFWLAKWLLFRYFVTMGISKFLSGDQKWWNLSGKLLTFMLKIRLSQNNIHFLILALESYFETQILPTPLSWYAHHLPKWILSLSMVYAHICEMVLPVLFFAPVRSVRITAFIFQVLSQLSLQFLNLTIPFYLQVILQICLVLTANFNLINILIVTLTFSLLDDEFFYGRPKKHRNNKWKALGLIINAIVLGAIVYGTIYLFSLKFTGSQIDAKIGKDIFDRRKKPRCIDVFLF